MNAILQHPEAAKKRAPYPPLRHRPGRLTPEDRAVSVLMMKKVGIAADAVCRAYDVSFEDVKNGDRRWRFVWPRWVLAHVLYELAGMHHLDIACVLCQRPSCSHHMRRGFRNEMATSRRVREFYEKVEAELRPKLNLSLEGYPTDPFYKKIQTNNQRTINGQC